jgi:integrase
MASLRPKLLDGNKKAYQVRWYDPNGIERSKQFNRQAEAKRFKAEIEATLARGTYIDPRAGKVTFREFAEKWRANQSHYRGSSMEAIERSHRLHIYPHIGDMPLAAVRRSDVQAMVAKWSPASAEKHLAYTSVVFKAAVLDEIIPTSPVRSIPIPRVSSEMIIPTLDQVLAIADAINPRYRGLILFAASTGLRRSELLAVTLESVDFAERVVRVRADKGQIVRNAGAPPRLGPPKTPAAARAVPLGDVALAVLREQMRAYPPNPDDGYGGLIFNGRNGVIHNATLSAQMGAVMHHAGFPTGTGLHLFRHFYASALIEGGESVKVVQKRLGHTSAAETLDTYGHLWPESDEASRTAIDAAFDRGDRR